MSSIKKSIFISVLALIQILTSFLLQVLLVKWFGVSLDLDIFLASGTINIILVAITSNALSYSLAPIIINSESAVEKARLLTTTVFFIILIFSLLAVIQDYYSDFIVSVLYPGLALRNLDLLSEMYTTYAYISIISVLNGAFIAICYANEKLIRTLLVPIIAMVVQIVILYLSRNRDVELVVSTYAINQGIISLLLGSICLKELSLKIKVDDNFLALKNRTLPLLLSSFFSKSDLIVDRNLISNLSAGLISSLHYSQLFVNSGLSILTKGLSIVSLTKLSRLNKVDDDEFNQYLNMVLKYLFIFLIYAQFTFVLNASGILEFIFEGEGYNFDIDLISKTIICLSGMFFGGALSTVIVNAYYVKGFNGFVAKVSIMLHVFGLVAKVVFFKLYGFYAIPVVFSVKSLVNCLILYLYYNINIRRISIRFNVRYFIKLTLFLIFLLAALLISDIYKFHIFVNVLLGTLVLGMFYINELFKVSKDRHVS